MNWLYYILFFRFPLSTGEVITDTVPIPQMYVQKLQDYYTGKKNPEQLLYLIHTASQIQHYQTADSIGKDYIRNFLPVMSDSDFFREDNLVLFITYNRSITSSSFKRFWKKRDVTDSIIHQKGLTQNYIESLIADQEIRPFVTKAKILHKKAHWRGLQRRLVREYGKSYCFKPLLNAKISYYKDSKDSLRAAQIIVIKMKKIGFDVGGLSGYLSNNEIYDYIFKHISNPSDLLEAAQWLKKIMKAWPKEDGEFWDTYANLLYKAGNKNEAFEAERKAVKLLPEDAGISQNWRNMQNNVPTW